VTEQVTRAQVVGRIEDYLCRRLTLAELVDWAERVMMDGEFADDDPTACDVVARLGVADVRAFGLSWEDCEDLLGRLGYRAEVTLRPANGHQ